MAAKASKTHEITIRVKFDAPLTPMQARYAVWDAICDYTLYGDGKPTARERRNGEVGPQPFGEGKITVRR